MKTIALGFAAALALGIASFAAPVAANAAPAAGLSQSTDFSAQRYHRMHRRGPVCTTRIDRTRTPGGRVIVRKVRVCR